MAGQITAIPVGMITPGSVKQTYSYCLITSGCLNQT
jgi:hypothetical protein